MNISALISMAGDGPNQFLLQSIGCNSQVLSTQQRDFCSALGEQGKSEVFFFYETLKSPTAVQVSFTSKKHDLSIIQLIIVYRTSLDDGKSLDLLQFQLPNLQLQIAARGKTAQNTFAPLLAHIPRLLNSDVTILNIKTSERG